MPIGISRFLIWSGVLGWEMKQFSRMRRPRRASQVCSAILWTSSISVRPMGCSSSRSPLKRPSYWSCLFDLCEDLEFASQGVNEAVLRDFLLVGDGRGAAGFLCIAAVRCDSFGSRHK